MQPLRWPNEVVRHKVLDLIGDFALLGAWPQCEVIAIKSGHELHATVTRDLRSDSPIGQHRRSTLGETWLNSTSGRSWRSCRTATRFCWSTASSNSNRVRARGYKNITYNEPVFAGHFPGNPLLPGVYMIEAMAQLGGAVVLEPGEFSRKTPYLAGIDKAKFRRPVVPGDRLDMEVVLAPQAQHRLGRSAKRRSTDSSRARPS